MGCTKGCWQPPIVRSRCRIASVSDANYTEFNFRGTPAEADAMHEALKAHVDRDVVEIKIALAAGLSPMEVAETIRVREGAKGYDEACKIAREHCGKAGT